jgi:hypothetical protein
VAPNPPETGAAPPPPTEAAEPKTGRGRPKGVKNKTLTVEQQVFVAGVAAAMQSPAWDGSSALLVQAGDLAVEAFNAKYGSK